MSTLDIHNDDCTGVHTILTCTRTWTCADQPDWSRTETNQYRWCGGLAYCRRTWRERGRTYYREDEDRIPGYKLVETHEWTPEGQDTLIDFPDQTCPGCQLEHPGADCQQPDLFGGDES